MRRLLKRFLVIAAVLSWLGAAPALRAQSDEGEKLFKTICVACHTIGKGRLVGPDLANVHERRSQEWLLKYVKSSQSVIKGGDPYAVRLFEEYNKVIMPDNPYTDAQITSIIEYVAANSPGGESGAGAVPPDAEPPAVTGDNVDSGRSLFVGKRRFENGGPTCISCHNINRQGITAGGALAKDVTNAHSRLGWAGLKAVIGNAPFPAMGEAFAGKPLTDEEVFDLTAFLQHVDGDDTWIAGPRYGLRLFLAGLGGSILLMGLFGGVWIRGKRRSVNHAIYERQVKSTWEYTDDSERVG